jgi:hypothetical protein
MENRLTIAEAGRRLALSYTQVLTRLLRHDLSGGRDGRGWFVDETSVDDALARAERERLRSPGATPPAA